MWQNMDAKMCLRLHEQDMRQALHGNSTKRHAKSGKPARAKAPGRMVKSIATTALAAWTTLGIFFHGTH